MVILKIIQILILLKSNLRTLSIFIFLKIQFIDFLRLWLDIKLDILIYISVIKSINIWQ